MLSGIPESAICVQRFDDSLNSAIHITYRISLRSSSLREPRDPLSKVVSYYFYNKNFKSQLIGVQKKAVSVTTNQSGTKRLSPPTRYNKQFTQCIGIKPISNDPTAGSPTVTLLRLVLPLNDQV